MPRHKAILQSEFPYNLSARCINKEWFNLPMDTVWQIYCEELSQVSKDKKLLIHSFLLMSNHFHLIASTPEENISQCMHQLMTRSSRRLTQAGNRINQSYSGRHYKCILHRHSHFLNAYKYNYRNPVAANICHRVEEYPYSTLSGILGIKKVEIPIVEDSTYNSDPMGTLQWLNTAPTAEKLEAVRYGLKRQYFKAKLFPRSHQPMILENDLI